MLGSRIGDRVMVKGQKAGIFRLRKRGKEEETALARWEEVEDCEEPERRKGLVAMRQRMSSIDSL